MASASAAQGQAPVPPASFSQASASQPRRRQPSRVRQRRPESAHPQLVQTTAVQWDGMVEDGDDEEEEDYQPLGVERRGLSDEEEATAEQEEEEAKVKQEVWEEEKRAPGVESAPYALKPGSSDARGDPALSALLQERRAGLPGPPSLSQAPQSHLPGWCSLTLFHMDTLATIVRSYASRPMRVSKGRKVLSRQTRGVLDEIGLQRVRARRGRPAFWLKEDEVDALETWWANRERRQSAARRDAPSAVQDGSRVGSQGSPVVVEVAVPALTASPHSLNLGHLLLAAKTDSRPSEPAGLAATPAVVRVPSGSGVGAATAAPANVVREAASVTSSPSSSFIRSTLLFSSSDSTQPAHPSSNGHPYRKRPRSPICLPPSATTVVVQSERKQQEQEEKEEEEKEEKKQDNEAEKQGEEEEAQEKGWLLEDETPSPIAYTPAAPRAAPSVVEPPSACAPPSSPPSSLPSSPPSSLMVKTPPTFSPDSSMSARHPRETQLRDSVHRRHQQHWDALVALMDSTYAESKQLLHESLQQQHDMQQLRQALKEAQEALKVQEQSSALLRGLLHSEAMGRVREADKERRKTLQEARERARREGELMLERDELARQLAAKDAALELMRHEDDFVQHMMDKKKARESDRASAQQGA